MGDWPFLSSLLEGVFRFSIILVCINFPIFNVVVYTFVGDEFFYGMKIVVCWNFSGYPPRFIIRIFGNFISHYFVYLMVLIIYPSYVVNKLLVLYVNLSYVVYFHLSAAERKSVELSMVC